MKNFQNIEVSLYSKENKLLKKFYMRKGGNLWVWLRKNGVSVGSACSGVGVCGACNVSVSCLSKDKMPLSIDVSCQSEFEHATLLRNGKNPEDRLSCLTRVYSDISIKAEYW